MPTCGMSDPALRAASCNAIIRACTKTSMFNAGMMRGVMDFVSQHMMASRNWTYQLFLYLI